jgi:hypothetical protein
MICKWHILAVFPAFMALGCGAEANSTGGTDEDPGIAELGVEVGEFASIESYNVPGHFLRHRGFLGELTTVSSGLDKADATFRLVRGLANTSCVSFESSNFPGHYLRHQGFRLKLHPRSNEELYRNDATFCIRSGIQPGVGSPWVSFESYNFPGYYIRHRDFHFYIENAGGPFRADATFRLTPPL